MHCIGDNSADSDDSTNSIISVTQLDYLDGTVHIVSAIFPASSAVNHVAADEAESWLNKPELLALTSVIQ